MEPRWVGTQYSWLTWLTYLSNVAASNGVAPGEGMEGGERVHRTQPRVELTELPA